MLSQYLDVKDSLDWKANLKFQFCGLNLNFLLHKKKLFLRKESFNPTRKPMFNARVTLNIFLLFFQKNQKSRKWKLYFAIALAIPMTAKIWVFYFSYFIAACIVCNTFTHSDDCFMEFKQSKYLFEMLICSEIFIACLFKIEQ